MFGMVEERFKKRKTCFPSSKVKPYAFLPCGLSYSLSLKYFFALLYHKNQNIVRVMQSRKQKHLTLFLYMCRILSSRIFFATHPLFPTLITQEKGMHPLATYTSKVSAYHYLPLSFFGGASL